MPEITENELRELCKLFRKEYRKSYLRKRNLGHCTNLGYITRKVMEENQGPYGHGVERIFSKRSSTDVFYLEMGDPYTLTVLAFVAYGTRVTFRLGTWGDLVESGRYDG